MKEESLRGLITAKTLFEQAGEMCLSEDVHIASAGLVILQDALELFFWTVLTEKGIGEDKNIDKLGFDELLGEVKKANVKIPKSGTLKALNKQRVITKHYAQLAEPNTVRNYYFTAKMALDNILGQIFGVNIEGILLAGLIESDNTRHFLEVASKYIENKEFFEALVEIRKAIYEEIESDFSIYHWQDYDDKTMGPFHHWTGLSAPYYTRSKDWIDKNVNDPMDFIQIDRDRLRLDLIDLGVTLTELENIQRMTPKVFYHPEEKVWLIEENLFHREAQSSEENARYCLDRATILLLRKQQHRKSIRFPKLQIAKTAPFYVDTPVYAKATQESVVVHIVTKEHKYMFHRKLRGFDQNLYCYISGYVEDVSTDPPSQGDHVLGYLPIDENDAGNIGSVEEPISVSALQSAFQRPQSYDGSAVMDLNPQPGDQNLRTTTAAVGSIVPIDIVVLRTRPEISVTSGVDYWGRIS